MKYDIIKEQYKLNMILLFFYFTGNFAKLNIVLVASKILKHAS